MLLKQAQEWNLDEVWVVLGSVCVEEVRPLTSSTSANGVRLLVRPSLKRRQLANSNFRRPASAGAGFPQTDSRLDARRGVRGVGSCE